MIDWIVEAWYYSKVITKDWYRINDYKVELDNYISEYNESVNLLHILQYI